MRAAPTLALAIALLACDPVHSDAVDALGGEAAGVKRGPTHRPGQPCVTCHDGAIGDPPAFSVAGTVYVDESGTTPASGATVTMTSSDGISAHTATTNEVGNFYVSPSQYTPTYPMKVEVTYGKSAVAMASAVGRDGSCADCHTSTAGRSSAGRVFIPADGGTP